MTPSRISLTTPRTVMLPAAERDLPTLSALWNEPGVREQVFDGQAIDAAHARRLLDAGAADTAAGLGWWLVCPRSNAPALGCVGLLRSKVTALAFSPPGEAFETLIAFSAETWAQGYAHEAMTELVRHALHDLRLPRLSALGGTLDPLREGLLHTLGFAVRLEVDAGSRRIRLYERANLQPPAGVAAAAGRGTGERVASIQEMRGCHAETAPSHH